MLVPLNAGKNTIEMFNVSDHGVARLDTMIVAPSEDELCSNAPTTPGDVISTLNRGVELTWLSSAWPQDCVVRYYDVYRSTTLGFIPSTQNRIATRLEMTSYADATASCGTTYYYLVQAVDTAGASASLNKTVLTLRCSTSIPTELRPPNVTARETDKKPIYLARDGGEGRDLTRRDD